jgi:hypothetical protein
MLRRTKKAHEFCMVLLNFFINHISEVSLELYFLFIFFITNLFFVALYEILSCAYFVYRRLLRLDTNPRERYSVYMQRKSLDQSNYSRF